MRRPLGVLAFALILLGFEVATGAVSLGASRLWLGLRASLLGEEFLVSPVRFAGGFTLLVMGAGTATALLWAERASRSVLPDARTCPQCGTRTKRVRRRKRHRILSRILETEVKRIHCERCGWSGLAA